jgi:hypothetical protein
MMAARSAHDEAAQTAEIRHFRSGASPVQVRCYPTEIRGFDGRL